MDLSAALGAWGFDLPRLRFAFRTALIACTTLLVASLLGLEHPQWAAMTVWITAQPTRGLLLEKGLFRIAGTVAGVTAGMLFLWITQGQPWGLIGLLTVWIALCAGIGNLQRGMVSYSTILAGYSASMVALLDRAHPESVLHMGFDRLATVLVGVVVVILVGYLYTPSNAEEEMSGRLRRLSARVLRHLHDKADAAETTKTTETPALHDLLVEMAALEEALETHGTGSLRSRRAAHQARSLMMAQLSLLLAQSPEPRSDELSPALLAVAEALERHVSLPQIEASCEHAVKAASALPAAQENLASMFRTLTSYLGTRHDEELETRHPVILHRDWIAARWAMIRAGLAMLLAGSLWLATGWSGGPYLLLGVSAMITLFSTFENPGRIMRFVLLGQVVGAAGALACRFLAWPFAHDQLQIVLLTMPFILLGALFFSHRRTAPVAFDYAMVSLLLLHPVYPTSGTFFGMLNGAVAVAAAPALALGLYRWVFPLDAGKRLETTMRMMIHELQGMATSDATEHADIWRARLYHRLLRLIWLAERSITNHRLAIAFGLTVLELGSAVFTLQKTRMDPASNAARSIDAALFRLKRLSSEPDKAVSALLRAADQLQSEGREAATLVRAARELETHSSLFRKIGIPALQA
jgi:uncharacterized membrane protein YccC